MLSEPPQLAQSLQKLLAKATQTPEFQLDTQQEGSVEQTLDTHTWQVGLSASPGVQGLCAQLLALPPPPEELLLTELVSAELDTEELAIFALLAVPPFPPTAAELLASPPAPPALPPWLLSSSLMVRSEPGFAAQAAARSRQMKPQEKCRVWTIDETLCPSCGR